MLNLIYPYVCRKLHWHKTCSSITSTYFSAITSGRNLSHNPHNQQPIGTVRPVDHSLWWKWRGSPSEALRITGSANEVGKSALMHFPSSGTLSQLFKLSNLFLRLTQGFPGSFSLPGRFPRNRLILRCPSVPWKGSEEQKLRDEKQAQKCLAPWRISKRRGVF